MRIDPVDQFQTENQNGCLSTHKKGLIESTEKAQALIMFSVVFVKNQKIDKLGTKQYVKKNVLSYKRWI